MREMGWILTLRELKRAQAGSCNICEPVKGFGSADDEVLTFKINVRNFHLELIEKRMTPN